MFFPVYNKSEPSSQQASANKSSPAPKPDNHMLLSLQKTIGNQATSQFMQLKTDVIQRKLTEQQAEAIRQDLEDYYQRSSQSKKMFKKDAEQIANKHGIGKFKDITNYYEQQFYYEKHPRVLPVRNGVLDQRAINRSPFSGETGTQRYLQKQSFSIFEDTHLSVSFKSNGDGTFTVDSLHVSFKKKPNDTDGVRFYWGVSGGNLTRSQRSFPAGVQYAGTADLAELQAKAVQMVKNSLISLNCADTNP